MATTQIKMYLHSTKDGNAWKAESEGLSFTNEDAERNFLYALYEVSFDVEVDLDTGDAKIITVDGKELT